MKVSGRKTGSALSHGPNDWYAVDWHRVERNVRGMQIRIAKATREGKWRRVKALQRMLTRTLSAKLYAVRRLQLLGLCDPKFCTEVRDQFSLQPVQRFMWCGTRTISSLLGSRKTYWQTKSDLG
jgi:hypothetical protein